MTQNEKRFERSSAVNKLKLLTSGSVVAAAVLLATMPQVAAAAGPTASGHAVNGNPDIVLGSASLTPGATTYIVNVNSAESVINWTPVDQSGTDPINFLPEGNTLQFRGNSAGYTVLNRILPTDSSRAIRFDGIVQGRSFDGAPTPTLQQSGNIWFYSPGGIIAGAGSVFDVGSLVLTTNDIDFGDGNLFGPNQEIRFRGATGSLSSVVVEGATATLAAASIDADNFFAGSSFGDDSYVAIVAPRVEQGGSVNADGSVAYVAAEQANLTINGNNLFSIEIPVGAGTGDANGIVHSGVTTGPSALDNGDRQHIYMVAVPKNQAMTMLLGGTIGHGLSASVGDADGQIILSAGGDVNFRGSFDNLIDTTADAAKNASIEITGANLTGYVQAFANNNLNLASSAGNNIVSNAQNRDRGALYTAGDSINISATTGSTIDLNSTGLLSDIIFEAQNAVNILVNPDAAINVTGDLTLNAFSDTQGGVVDIDLIGSGSRVTGSGELNVDGTFNIFAGVVGQRSRFATVDDGTDTFGGAISVDITAGGLLDIDSSAGFGTRESVFSVSASANHGLVTGADSFGGTIDINVDGIDSALNVTGFSGLELEARGNSTSTSGGSSTGGSGTGGAVNLTVNGGTITADNLFADAGAEGSSNATINTNESINSAFSGDVTATFTDATLNIGQLSLNTGAAAARSFDAMDNVVTGNAAGGDLAVTFDNTNFNGTSLGLNGDTNGTDNVLNGLVAAGDEGSTTLNIRNGSTLALTGDFNMSGRGTADADGSSGSADINFLVNNATFSAANINLENSRTTRAPAGMADGNTGDINFTVENSGSVTAGTLSLSAFASSPVPGGQATAGNVNLLVDAGTLTLTEITDTSLRIDTSGIGSDNDGSTGNTTPGLGIGGDIDVTLQGGGIMALGSVDFTANGLIAQDFDGQGVLPSGQGGSGIGGSVTINLNGSTFTATDLDVSASGFASNGGDSSVVDPFTGLDLPNVVGDGGLGTGGDVAFNLRGTDVTVNNLTVAADGTGGSGGNSRETEGVVAGNGGQGIGGTATFNANSGSLTVNNSLTVSSGGFGGNGGDGEGVDAGNGGDSIGGTSIFNLEGTASVNANTASISVSSDTTGGAGGNALIGNTPTPAPTPAQQAGSGGNAIAGTATYNSISGDIGFNDFTVSSIGTGGAAGRGGRFIPDPILVGETIFEENFVGQNGGNAGSGTGGNATINLNQDDAVDRAYTVDASGIGASGSFGINGGDGGLGQGGTASLNINNASVNLSSATISATATGGAGAVGNGTGGNGGAGGDAIGGTAILDVNGAAGALSSSSIVTIISEAAGGAGGAGGDNPIGSGPTGAGGAGGDGTGGTIQVSATGGATLNYTADGLTNATGIGGIGGAGGNSPAFNVPGNGGAGGNGSGGNINFSSTGGSTFNGSGNSSDSQLMADAVGGAGGLGGTGAAGTFGDTGNGGGAAGGNINLTVDGVGSSMIFAQSLRLDVRGVADRTILASRVNYSGGDASGGAVVIAVTDGGDFTVNGALAANSAALGGFGDLSSGSATGGNVDISMSGATSNFDLLGTFDPSDPDFNLQNRSLAIQTGDDALTTSTTASAGDDISGDVSINFTGGTANLGSDVNITTQTTVFGTNGDGNAVAGDVDLTFTGGVVTVGDLNVLAGSRAGNGLPGSASGSGTGGDITVTNTGNLTIGAVVLTSRGQSGRAAGGGTAGDAIGGSVSFSSDSVLNGLTNLALRSDAFGNTGQAGATTVAGGEGGSAVSGDITLSLAGTGTINPTNIGLVSLAIGGLGGAGGVSDGTTGASGADGGAGGDATAGNVIFTNNRTADAISDLSLISNAFASGGGIGGLGSISGNGGNGGDGGQGQGGLTRVDLSGGGAVLASGANVTLSALGFGGVGRAGATGTGVTPGNGGDGGDGIGGTAIANLGNDNPNPILVALDASGTGAAGGDGLNGGDGGIGTGGLAALNVIDATVVFDDPSIIANGIGGNGGLGSVDPISGNAGSSGNAGNATGGTARLEVTGDNGNVDIGFIILESNATGGAGGSGEYGFLVDGGGSGTGGDADGGTSEIVARTGGTINLTSGLFSLTSTGTGGQGGDGGGSYADTAADGSDGGQATGGTARLLAQGGTISGNDVNITTTGQGGDAGIGGIYGGFGAGMGGPGVTGTGGTGIGGTATIEVQEGSPGIITLGNVVTTANGTSGTGLSTFAGFGGRIEITDSSTDPAGLITLGSLTADAFDTDSGSILFSNSTPLSGFYVTGDSGAMSILGDLIVNVVGNIEYDFDGDSQMTVSGNAVLNSGQNILINHTNNATPVNSIDVSGTFDANAAFDFISTDGSRINSGGTATVRAEQDATVADITGVGLVNISALQDVEVNNAAVTGTPFVVTLGTISIAAAPQLVINAGFDPTATPLPTYNRAFGAIITGDVTSTGRIDVSAGGTAFFQGGSNVISDNGLAVRAGDDIIVEAGASLTAANAPSTAPNALFTFTNPGNLVLQTDNFLDIFGTPNATSIGARLTPISSIVAAGDLNANAFAVVMTANAIDGFGGTITASSISADINDAPTNAIIDANLASNDADLLSADCIQGNACFGTIIADNQVLIGQASNNDIVSAFIESGTVTADIIRVTTRSDIVMGTNGIATELNAATEFLAESTEGDVNLFDAAVSSASIQIIADGSLLGSGSLTSVNSIGIDVGGSIAAAGIATGGELAVTAGDMPGFYSVPGSMVVGSLTVGSGNINYDAGGDFIFGSISVPGTDINLVAVGDIDIGSSLTASNINLDGFDITLGSVSANSDINLLAASTIDFGSVSAGNLLDMTAVNISGDVADGNEVTIFADFDVDANSISAGDTLVVEAVNITIGDASGGTVSINGSDIVVGGVSGGSVDISGDQISIDGASAGNLSIGGGDISVGSISADSASLFGDAIFVDSAEGGELDIFAQTRLDVNLIDIDENATLEAAGPMVIGTANTGGNASLLAETVTLGDGNVAGDLSMEATAGDIDGNGIVAVGGAIDLDATGDIGFGSLSAGTTFDANAGGAIIFAGANADSDLTLDAAAEISGGDASSGAELTIFGTDLELDSLSSESSARLGARDGNIAIDTVDINSSGLFGSATGTITIDTVTASNGIRLEGAGGIEINSATSTIGTLISTDGDVAVREDAAFSNALTARGNSVFIRSNGSLKTVAQANVGDIDIVTVGNLSVDDATAVGNIRLTSLTGSAELNDIISGNASFGTSATGITGQATTSSNGNIDVTAALDVVINSTTNAANALTITAGNLIDIQALASGTTIDLSSADISINTAGQLGIFDQTNDIFIESNGINQAILGGAGTTGVFSLSEAEFTRIQSNQDLTIFVASTGGSTPDLIIQDLTIQTGDNVSGTQIATIGFSGALTIDSGQSTRVDGNLNLTNASGGTTLNMTSVDDLRINANGGVIQITDASGSFGGVGLMTLTAQNIYAVTDQAFADIAGLDTNAVDLRLENNDGIDIDDGLIRGGIAQFIVDGDLFIQNTAPGVDFADRRGFSVDSLTISGLSAGSNANIVINGIVNGQTGIDTIFATDTVVGFDDPSTINGCVIIDPSSCGAPPPTPTPTPTPTSDPEIDDPVQDVIEEEVTPREDGSIVSDPFETNLIEIKDNEEYVDDPLIDEPVTGAGNDDLWVSDEDASGDENDECEDGDDSCGEDGTVQEDELEPAE